MSLPAIAKQLESKGRHGDTKLIHVSDAELKGLHALAAAHGKTITVNPETGLPEAFSFSSLLPTIIGAGLSIASGGALSPLMAAGIAGAGYGVATGSLQKGLMAGLGAYGGAGLAEGLAGVGAGAPPVGGAPAAAPPAAVPTPPPLTAALDPSQVQAGLGGNNMFSNYVSNTGANVVSPAANQQALLGIQPVPSVSTVAANTPAPSFMDAAGNQWDKVSSGAGKLYEGGWDSTSKFLGANKMNLGMAAAPILTDALTPSQAAPAGPQDKGKIRPYSFDYGRTDVAGQNVVPVSGGVAPTYDTVTGLGDTSERTYFTPTFTAKEPYAAATGGIVGYSMGGPVERDAAIKAVGMNTEFPMAHIDTPIYANPQTQRPDAKEVVNPSGDVGVDMFTGEPRMANGGIARYGLGGTISGIAQPSSDAAPTKSYAYNPKTQEFTETTTAPAPAAQPQMRGLFGIPGLVPSGMAGIGGGGGGFGYGLIARLIQQQQAQQAPAQPTVSTRVTGGIMDPYTPQDQQDMAVGGMAGGGYNLGGYSDGGRLLKGPGDGVSDSIPASIGDRQPARLADGEFVVPARIVSELGNGSTEAGAKKLYAMMDRVQKQRSKTVGKGKVAVNSRADKHLPA